MPPSSPQALRQTEFRGRLHQGLIDTRVEQLVESGEASDDLLNDYPNGDSYHHESHVDRSYSVTEAAEILDAYSDYEETDSGLWEGTRTAAGDRSSSRLHVGDHHD